MSVFAVGNAAHSQAPSPRSGQGCKDTLGISPACLAAGLGIQELALETRQTDIIVGGSGATGPAPDLLHQQASQAGQTWIHIKM